MRKINEKKVAKAKAKATKSYISATASKNKEITQAKRQT